MTSTGFTISGFGDEIADDPAEQLSALAALGIAHLDLRGAWGRNVLDFSDDDIAALRRLLRDRRAAVAMIASPVGKSPISQPASYEADRLTVAMRMAAAFDTPLVRIFSFYPEDVPREACRDEVVARLRAWAATAERAGVTLLLENEGGLWTDTPAHCRDILAAVDSPALRFTLDAGNFASVGAAAHDEGYALLRPWVRHIQIKDMVTASHRVVPAGEGDGQIPALLAAARRDGYRGYLSLEPHLAVAGRAGGFTGPDLFGTAARALEDILDSLGEPADSGLSA